MSTPGVRQERDVEIPPQRPQRMPPKTMTEELWNKIEPTTLNVFHNPADPTSMRTTEAIQAAVHMYPGPPKNPKFVTKFKVRGALKLEVIVHERAPTAEEFRLILFLLPDPTYTSFIKPDALNDLRAVPTSSKALVQLIERQPELMLWPIVVDWEHDQASLGRKYKSLLDNAADRRAKVLTLDKPVEPERPEVPPATEWIDYD
ncbi:hypothetical protein C8F04DRAFT_1266311 [Mycena alexandri]|uniref:Uncharacterized protein n=1 Tax=Mycena alexandri TaxID=1745969 RepID=A0AAD6WXB2_9AGAR|nr:hypothetical protein C8F04DRAFT_1266311 [Mycena alexandri]